MSIEIVSVHIFLLLVFQVVFFFNLRVSEWIKILF